MRRYWPAAWPVVFIVPRGLPRAPTPAWVTVVESAAGPELAPELAEAWDLWHADTSLPGLSSIEKGPTVVEVFRSVQDTMGA